MRREERHGGGVRAARIAAFAFPRPSHAKTRRNGREKGVLQGEAFAFGLRFPSAISRAMGERRGPTRERGFGYSGKGLRERGGGLTPCVSAWV